MGLVASTIAGRPQQDADCREFIVTPGMARAPGPWQAKVCKNGDFSMWQDESRVSKRNLFE